MNAKILALGLLALASALVQAGEGTSSAVDVASLRAEPGNGSTTLQVNAAYERLSKNLPAWREYGVTVKHDLDARQFVEAGLTRTSRFDLQDERISGLYLAKITTDLITTVEGDVSPTHRVLPKYTLGGTVDYTFLPATVGTLGLKTTAYDATRVNQVSLGAERYIGAFSLGISWHPARAFGEWTHSGQARASYFYGPHDSVALLLAAGEEVTPVGQLQTLARVRAAALIGQHWLNRDWAMSYALSHTRQGKFYNRTGVSIGLRYAFR